MTEAIMAHPDLRHPFDRKAINNSGEATVLYGGQSYAIKTILGSSGLWVTSDDLTRINGFEIKPQGACFEELCIPLKADSELLREEEGEQWFDLLGFAEWIEQPYVADEENRVWSFGEIPAKRDNMLSNGMAPEFELLDRQGEVVRMSDFKGKKALIITWSSW